MSHRRYKIEVHAIRFVFYANSLLLLLLFCIMKLTIAEILDSFICHIYGVWLHGVLHVIFCGSELVRVSLRMSVGM